jgi:nitroimidazol reductase NimA-like FMN-containing flavoprotein (pyridoxamine 5'-phosphate oxidase superfamily)
MQEIPHPHKEKAKAIINENKYMVLATSDKESKPWASPVFFAHDERYNFYFLSSINSRHAKNILSNPNVGIAIFDSRQKMGQTEGLQIEAVAGQIGKNSLDKAIEHYCMKAFPNSGSGLSPSERYDPEEYIEPHDLRFFKVSPEKIYIVDIEKRVAVDIF